VTDTEATDAEAAKTEATESEATDSEATDSETPEIASADAAPSGDDGGPGGVRGWLRRHGWVVPTLVVGLVIAAPLRGVFRAPGAPMEEGFMLVFPERLLHGEIPNKDYLHLYGPGSIWVLAGFFKVLGVSLWTERLVGIL
jgi:hypothetical protein